MRDQRYDRLFEPVKIGPVTAPNRFYQVPHCSGMGYQRPQTMAAMRGMKAEGGWGVVCTEYCSIHPSSDDVPFPSASLWDQGDVANLRLMTEAVHKHGSLAGVELWYGGRSTSNLYTRENGYGLSSMPSDLHTGMPVQSRIINRRDIDQIRRWHKEAAKRALDADFDIVYVYANHQYLLHEFLSPVSNKRVDEYGGSAQNRVRLLREIIEETLETVGHRSAVAVRYSIPPVADADDEGMVDMFKLIAELPDLWDVTVNDYSLEMGSSRFIKEASNQSVVAKIKSLTTRPVVSVGRFTSPDTMLAQIRNGVQDFIGAARPSIADPFLPKKIQQGRIDDIRECIGCNVCYAFNSLAAPIRCTQNPTMGEEWRRGWHPEQLLPATTEESVLVIGAGPAGLEATRALGKRGYQVTLVEAKSSLGGRVALESQLPGLAEWARVRDWRVGQIEQMANVDVYPDNRLAADAVLEFGAQHVLVATGSSWRTDGVGRWNVSAFAGWQSKTVISVDQILAGYVPKGKVVVYDDDHYYIGSAIALMLRTAGTEVTMVTPEGRISDWSRLTDEQGPNIKALLAAGVELITDQGLVSWQGSQAGFECVFSGQEMTLDGDYLIPITARLPQDGLWLSLFEQRQQFFSAGGLTMNKIGDCNAPNLITAAVYAGYKAACELGVEENDRRVPARDTLVVRNKI